MPPVRRRGPRESHPARDRAYDRLMSDTATADRQLRPGRVSRLVRFPVTRILLSPRRHRRGVVDPAPEDLPRGGVPDRGRGPRNLVGARHRGGPLRTRARGHSERFAVRRRGNRGRSAPAARCRIRPDAQALARRRYPRWMELHAGGCLRTASLGPSGGKPPPVPIERARGALRRCSWGGGLGVRHRRGPAGEPHPPASRPGVSTSSSDRSGSDDRSPERALSPRVGAAHGTGARPLPRSDGVYAVTHGEAGFDQKPQEEQEDTIFEKLQNEPSVKNLVREVQRHGGLIERVLVRVGTMEVIEGNSRLAVYRILRDKGADGDWDRIPCHVISTLTDEPAGVTSESGPR